MSKPMERGPYLSQQQQKRINRANDDAKETSGAVVGFKLYRHSHKKSISGKAIGAIMAKALVKRLKKGA